ncbi:facilitated trehalose transporter Tret1-like [Bombus vosnesenskii]|uniref:Facilitated trehalose transporter Tret1-like n=2 Tax=Pyrobombus TaxID=144703 RepID=A0A6J3LAD8_9HYME|nr:facilitated trehalose transporter Tret1-like [Bombus vosnesenskii]XP_033362155.1 facilitated trehalose transporter Tret1-like [Bombus vosnesenskii]XP_033362156.1 facilitated trehalose transporter Tret1-like [Bombus vosnesenskii]XP_033362157.1 facilitated trehalose transporter Tret1-like [Bombus vosnesenskii]XP_050483804.1 facilitated trehalose transporter Tret1-like isoform X2 [Bombus huntii]XP_050483805.1 facilitated trehalose transporter Tret1-like isoform X2 [Bombus huntii]
MADRGKEDYKNLFRRRLPQYIAACAACMGGFSLGCGIGWSAPCVEVLKEKHEYDTFSTNVIASVFPLGAALGMPVVPFLVDKIGRKWTMMSLVPAFLLGWMFITIGVTTFVLLVMGRLITGACGGMFCVVAPMYSAEISEKEIRGTLGVFFQLLLVIGILYAYCCGYARNIVVISILCGIAPLLFASIMTFMPESPLFYMAKDNEEAAKKSMRFFRGSEYDIDPEISAFKDQIDKSRREKVTFSAFLKKPVLKTMGVAYGLMFAQQFSGINAIIFYCETIFRQTGVDMDPLLQMLIFAVVQVIACAISASLIDQLGRKILMMISCGVMCLCLMALGIFFVLRTNNPDQADRLFWLPLVSACLYILAFCLGAGPIPWAYMGEIFPAKLKGTASSSAACLNWMLAFIVTVSFSSVVDAVGNAAVFFFFAMICLLSVVFVTFCMVETKGKTFADIQREFGTYDVNER